jgi:hypothetical protein
LGNGSAAAQKAAKETSAVKRKKAFFMTPLSEKGLL